MSFEVNQKIPVDLSGHRLRTTSCRRNLNHCDPIQDSIKEWFCLLQKPLVSEPGKMEAHSCQIRSMDLARLPCCGVPIFSDL